MSKVLREKFTADVNQPFVFFMTGGHVNNLLKVHKWLPVAWNFLKLVRYLGQHPETGCISGQLYLRVFPFGMIFHSYWRSFDELEAFARSKDEGHLGAWRDYMQRVGLDGSMAVYHELYMAEPGTFEVGYINSAPYGLSKAMGVKPATGRLHSARGRINPEAENVPEEPLIPMPPQL